MATMRAAAIERLQRGTVFDLLVIGGGATGCGIALDGSSRGLETALVEKSDFAEGTSGRSTKLVHGGVRYLEMAVKRLDRAQYHLVRDALHERGILLNIAPHLCRRLPLITPLYKWREVPYILAGLKLYDLLAGRMGLGHSRLVSRSKALERFPMLRQEGLKAGVQYYDGQFNDARMAVSLAMTAREHGATVANHVAVVELLKEKGRVCGAVVQDSLGTERWPVKAKVVVNATGPFADHIRRLDDPGVPPMLTASSGIHILLDRRFAPPSEGLLIPETEDGRVLFVLPWEGHALVGTTDEPAPIEAHPRPSEAEVEYLLRHLRRYFNMEVEKADILSSWSGLRPLVSDPKAVNTARLTRDHVLEDSRSGLLTIAGGKWTTYRKMAMDVVDHALSTRGLVPRIARCHTDRIKLVGGAQYREDGHLELAATHGLDPETARHLNHSYGDRASVVAEIATSGLSNRLSPGMPQIQAEVVYGARHESALCVMDILARRTPLALLNVRAARSAVEETAALMAGELGWDAGRQATETERALERLAEGI